jgi:hypothetical protein
MSKAKKLKTIPPRVYKRAIDLLFKGNDFGAAWEVQKNRKFHALPDSGDDPPNTKLGRIIREATVRAMDAALESYGLKDRL